MGIVITLPTARSQINQIVDYIAADNLPAALHWLEEIGVLFSLLSTQPEMAQEVHTRSLGRVRRHVFGNYSIYYQSIPGGVEILRVFHGARDQNRLV